MAGICIQPFKRISNLSLKTISLGIKIPVRTTYIFKRKYAPLLSKENALKYRRLKPKHFIYELIEDTNEKEPPDLHVVLTSFVEGIGDVGEMISVQAHFARQSLLLPKKAVYATPENIKHYTKQKTEKPQKPDFSSIYAGMTIRFLSKKVVPVFMSSEDSWTLEPWHIRVAFRTEGIIIPEDAIKLLDGPIIGPDPMKEDRDFVVSITINDIETVPVRCRLFQLRKELGINKLSEEFYLGKREAILKEQEELLNSLPMPELEDNRPEANISLKEKYRIKLLN